MILGFFDCRLPRVLADARNDVSLGHCKATAEAINEQRTTKKSARMRSAAALWIPRLLHVPLRVDSKLPATAHSGNVRAVRSNVDACAVERDIYKRSAQIKSVLGDWGSKGDKGNASQVVFLVPLEEIIKIRISKN